MELPVIMASEETPLVKKLVGIIEQLQEYSRYQTETLQELRDEVARLKGEKGKPKFKPSGMQEKAGQDGQKEKSSEGEGAQRPGSAKRAKTAKLVIHERKKIRPSQPIPQGSRFKGYRKVVVQDLKIEVHNTCYRLEVWETPDGESLIAELPPGLKGHRFGSFVRTYILYQHHHCQVSQPLLHEQLREWGIDISTGQIDAILTEGKEHFFAERERLLAAGLAVSDFITVDDSGARHQGRNGYVTHIGNDFFAWLSSTESKSRINFLQLLHAGSIAYRVNREALNYMHEQGLAQAVREQLQTPTGPIGTPLQWGEHLDHLGIVGERHRRIATEGALIGALLEKEDFNPNLAIVSDGAGQFVILAHGLCWVHAERLVHKLIPMNDLQRAAVTKVRGEFWDLYADLKAYRLQPDVSRIAELEARFTAIFTQRTDYATLNGILKRIGQRKQEMLLVLRRPEVPLHTNGSETDIRDYVKKRKVSGGTRSELGRTCRDTFASLKKTCRKLGISFWDFLIDRVSLAHAIPPLADIVRQRATAHLGASP